MNILQQLESLTRVAEAYPLGAPVTRRGSLAHVGRGAIDLAKAVLPVGVAAGVSGEARAQASGGRTAVEVFGLVLTLEYLEAEFYERGLSASGLVAEAHRDAIAQIGKHERAHVAFLGQAISDAGGTPNRKPEFDFTAGGAFADVFRNPATFLAVAQALEDTGVRAYKGQAGFLVGDKDLLQAALQIHSTEARHAAIIRRMRGREAWIPFRDGVEESGATFRAYDGEQNVTQLGVDASAAPYAGGTSPEQVTAAYDEPLSTADANAIVGMFIR